MGLFHRRGPAEDEPISPESDSGAEYPWMGDAPQEEAEEENPAEQGLTEYDVYEMSVRERIAYILAAAAVIFAVGLIFYQNPIFAGILALASLRFPKIRTAQIIRARKRALSMQFKDMLYALSSSMSAGRSLESAFRDALRDLEILYPDPQTPIMQETSYIIRCIEMNMPAEDALSRFAARAHIEDIENFADVIRDVSIQKDKMLEKNIDDPFLLADDLR